MAQRKLIGPYLIYTDREVRRLPNVFQSQHFNEAIRRALHTAVDQRQASMRSYRRWCQTFYDIATAKKSLNIFCLLS